MRPCKRCDANIKHTHVVSPAVTRVTPREGVMMWFRALANSPEAWPVVVGIVGGMVALIAAAIN